MVKYRLITEEEEMPRKKYRLVEDSGRPRAGQRGSMVTEGTISREDYLAQRGGVGFGGRAVPQDVGTAPDGPAMTYNDEGLLGKKPVVSSDAIKDRMFGLDLGTTSRALDTPQRMNVDKMSMAQSAALGVNDLNPIRLATGDRGYEAAMTESLADNPMSTRGGQSLALLSGGGAQLYTAGMKVAPKLIAPAVAARLAGDQLWKQGIRYAGRGVAMTGLGAADYYGYNALAEAPNIARETGAPGPSMGQRIDYANSQIFTPGGAVAALAPFASSLIARPTRYALASGKNVLQAAGNKVLPQAVPAPRQGITQTSKMTPADVQRRVAGFSADLSTMTKTDAEGAIDMLLKRGFDPDEAEKMVRFLDYAGKSEVPETLFQLMPNLRRVDQLTVALGTVGGDAKEALAKVLGEQAQESPIVLRNALRKAMGISGKDFYDMQKGIQADQLSAPKEGYKAAYAKEVSDETWDAQILPQLRTKYGREAVADAADYAEGIAGTDPAQLGVARQLAELRDALGSQGATPGKVSTQSLDYIDRMLGDVAEGLKAGTGRRELAKGPKGTQRGIRGNADSGLDAETGLDAPRRLSWELQSAEEAMVFGRKAYKDGTDIETLMDEFAYELSKAGRDGGESETVRGALLMGWLRGAEDDISKATNPQSVIRRMYGSERQREKLLAMMPELADDAGAGFKGSNTKDVRALVGGKREDGREMAGMIDRLKRVSGDYNRIIGNSQSAQRAAAVLEEGGAGDKINRVLDAVLAPKRAAVDVVKAGINVATRPGIYSPGVNRELGRLLTARGKKQLLATIAEIRARQVATGKGPKPPGGSPALPPPAGPIRAGGFAGFGGKKPRLEDTKTIPEAAAVLSERFKPRKATRAATEQDWEQASKEAFDLLREQARKQDGFEPGVRVRQEKAPDSLTDPKAPPRFVFEDLAEAILRSRGIDPDPVYGRMLAERPTNAETDVFRKAAGHYAGKARAKEREGMALDQMDDTDAAIEQMSNIKPPSRLNGIGAGLRTDLGSGVGGAAFAGAMPMDADATLQDRLNRAGTGFALGYGASKGGRIAARMRDGNAFAGKTATAGVPNKIGARTADAAAIAALGIPPTAEAQTQGGSAEVQAANERINELATFEANAQQKIGNAEQELKAFQGMSVAEKQRFLRDNGFTGPNGEILKDDGATGGLTTYAINRYTDKVRGAISEGTRELSTVRGEMDKAQQAALKAERQAKLKAMQAKNQPNMALDMASKAAMLAGLAGGVYWAKRGRSGAVAKSAPAAKAAAAKANALLNSKRMTSAKTGPDSLNQRAANINAFWKQGGAGDKVPFKVDGQGNWTDRPGAMEPAQLFSPKWHQQYRNDDVLYMVTAAVDVGGSRAGINYLNDEIKKVDAEYKAYEAQDDFASMERKLAEKTRLEGLRTALQITEKVGGGYLLGRAVGSPLMPYAKVNANVKAAEAQRASLLQKMNPPQKPRPASNNQGQGNP